ncbi:uncharacterized protein LOC110833391 isoform X3 [Zootermopsis nevadensis]|uniref:uncharacterized protein LOC110833391 isoform X3 n=1 Tax=Zootermopsis nevadensis TaxID=136037 RepID=UPI000B8E6E71|nr:uncharacterized protein LOC110833391 isoform X3 [Zootermopsis nevadensis]
MDAVNVKIESKEESSVPSPTEYDRESHEDEPLPFLFAAVKTEIEEQESWDDPEMMKFEIKSEPDVDRVDEYGLVQDDCTESDEALVQGDCTAKDVALVQGSGMMQAAVGLEDPRSQLVLASAPASEDEDRLVHVADQCCLNLGFDDGWCLTDEEPLDPAELSTSGAPTCPEELSHSDRPPPPAELSDSAELCGSDRPSSSPAELSHCDAARSELPAEESRRESSDEIDWSWLAALEAHRMSRDESPRPASAWLRSSMRRVRPFRLSEPPSIPASSAPLGPLATPDTVLHILAHNNRRPNSAPGGGVSRARRDFPRRYSSYNAAALDSSVTNLTQAAEPVAVESPSSDEEDEDLSSASDGAQTSGAEQATDSFAETMSNGTSSRQTHEPEIQNSPLGAWPHGLSSMLASLGCTLGLFNISRFAILSVHFGANFIVQFLFLTLVIGIPLFTLHTCLGQCLGAGVMDMWHISPIFQGIGIALLISQALIGIYSVVGVSWMFIYFRDSFITKQDSYRWAEPYDPYREESHTTKNVSWKLEETVPDYFNGIVLQRHNLEMPESSFGHLKFQVAFNLAVVWMIVFVSLSKGLKSYGKVVYVFSLFPVFGTLVLCTKLLGLVPTNTKHQVFPQTAWGEFFLNTKLGIFVVHFLDYTIGCSWWLMVLYLLEILAVFVVRGRPYSGETVVTTMFSRSAGCLQAWAAPLLIFTWNVILPVALVVTCITVFKNGQFRDLYNWHSVTYNYWPVWTREVGCMLQLLPIILVPFVCIVQTFRYLSIGPPDILDRIQLLYRPPISRQDSLEPPNSPPNSATLVPPVVNTTATSLAPEATVTTEDPPPKYTPPPSYTTATGARIAKLLRQSFRRSMRRLAGALGDNGTLPPPPDYTAVLVEINRTLQDHSEHLPEPSSAHPVHTSTMTATDVACILRSSLRRSVMRNRDIEHLVDGAVPVHHDVALPTTRAGSDSKPEAESTSVI